VPQNPEKAGKKSNFFQNHEISPAIFGKVATKITRPGLFPVSGMQANRE
jgi:hypothetical protein